MSTKDKNLWLLMCPNIDDFIFIEKLISGKRRSNRRMMFLQLFYSVINRFEFQYGKHIAKEKTKFDIKNIFSLKKLLLYQN